MTRHAVFTENQRHGRLFELIRQDNLFKQDAPNPPESEMLDMAEMQRFLKRANRSFRLDDESGPK